eukprot:symbB.v1.2.009903.t1/scaffold605.1/size182108/3
MLASFDILRRLLGENAAEMLQRWAKTRLPPMTLVVFGAWGKPRCAKMTELQRRAQMRLLLHFDAWVWQLQGRRARHSHAEAMRKHCGLHGARQMISAWFEHRRKMMATQRLFQALDRDLASLTDAVLDRWFFGSKVANTWPPEMDLDDESLGVRGPGLNPSEKRWGLHSEVTTADSRRPPEISTASRGSSQATGGLQEDAYVDDASGTSDFRGPSSDGHSGLRGLDVIAKARQRIREVKERERLEKLREQEEAEQRRREAQAQHEQRMKRQESERRRRRQAKRLEEESQATAQAEERRRATEHCKEQEEKSKVLQKQIQARIKAEKEKAKEKKEQDLLQKEERGRGSEEASKKAQEAMDAAKKRLIQKRKQELAKKEEEESMQKLEAEYEQEKESHEMGEVLQKKAQERLRHRSEERRKKETQAKNREALERLEREEHHSEAEKQIEERRHTAAQRAASRRRKEREEEERVKREQEEQERQARERKLLYRNPSSIAELKSQEPVAPLTQQHRRATSQKKQQEQEKLRRYAEGLPAESPERGRPPLLPSLESRRGRPSKAEESRDRANGDSRRPSHSSRRSGPSNAGSSRHTSPSPSVVSLPDIETGQLSGQGPQLEVLPPLEALPEPEEDAEKREPSPHIETMAPVPMAPVASQEEFHLGYPVSTETGVNLDASLSMSSGLQVDEPDVHVHIQVENDELAVKIRTE